MNLTEFLLLLFDKQTDRYPIIRKLFLQCWNTNEIIDILAITNYHMSINEFKDCIAYSCLDKGIRIKSLSMPHWRYPHKVNVDRLILDKSILYTGIIMDICKWIQTANTITGVFRSMFEIASENSEFTIFAIFIVESFQDRGKFLSIECKIESKENSELFIDEDHFALGQYSQLPRYPSGMHTTIRFIKHLCFFLYLPVSEFKDQIINARTQYEQLF